MSFMDSLFFIGGEGWYLLFYYFIDVTQLVLFPGSAIMLSCSRTVLAFLFFFFCLQCSTYPVIAVMTFLGKGILCA